jgi:hypothetical protein
VYTPTGISHLKPFIRQAPYQSVRQSAKRGEGGYLERWQGSTRVTNRSAMCDFRDDDPFYTFSNSPAAAAARISAQFLPGQAVQTVHQQFSANHTCRATIFSGRMPCWVSSLGPGHCGSIPPFPPYLQQQKWELLAGQLEFFTRNVKLKKNICISV